MLMYVFLFLLGSLLGWFACEFADRWGCSKRYFSSPPKKLFIVFISGIAAAWLYWWVVQNKMLMPPGLEPGHTNCLHQYIVLLILFTFLLAATLTDFYEMIIPDSITVVGTILALCLVVLCQFAALPVTEIRGLNNFNTFVSIQAFPMHVCSPRPTYDLFLGFDVVGSGSVFSIIVMTILWWF